VIGRFFICQSLTLTPVSLAGLVRIADDCDAAEQARQDVGHGVADAYAVLGFGLEDADSYPGRGRGMASSGRCRDACAVALAIQISI
jgi:hypothetical protein